MRSRSCDTAPRATTRSLGKKCQGDAVPSFEQLRRHCKRVERACAYRPQRQQPGWPMRMRNDEQTIIGTSSQSFYAADRHYGAAGVHYGLGIGLLCGCECKCSSARGKRIARSSGKHADVPEDHSRKELMSSVAASSSCATQTRRRRCQSRRRGGRPFRARMPNGTKRISRLACTFGIRPSSPRASCATTCALRSSVHCRKHTTASLATSPSLSDHSPSPSVTTAPVHETRARPLGFVRACAHATCAPGVHVKCVRLCSVLLRSVGACEC